MAEELLGPAFEIHGGGLDLVFPHHENEVAQSRALGHPFAPIWAHNGMLRFTGEKMSKSLGNVTTLREAIDEWGREALLVFFLAGHWRKPIDFSDETMAQAAAPRRDAPQRVHRSRPADGADGDWSAVCARRSTTTSTRPRALAVLHGWASARRLEPLRRALAVFGLESLAERDGAAPEVAGLAERRQQARAERDFAARRPAARRARRRRVGDARRARRRLHARAPTVTRGPRLRPPRRSRGAARPPRGARGLGDRAGARRRAVARRGRGRSVQLDRELTERAGTRDHQGVVALVEPYRYADAYELAAGRAAAARRASTRSPTRTTSARSAGAPTAPARPASSCPRTARRSSPRRSRGPRPARSSTCRSRSCTNLARYLEEVKGPDLWVYGAAGDDGATPMWEADLSRRARARLRRRGQGPAPARPADLRRARLDPARRRGRVAERQRRRRAPALRGAGGSVGLTPTLYLFDGYNLLHAGPFGDAARARRRARRASSPTQGARGVARVRRRGRRPERGPLEVRYAADADTLLERLAAEHRGRERVVLVSSRHAVAADRRASRCGSSPRRRSSATCRRRPAGRTPSGRARPDKLDAETRARLERLRRGTSNAGPPQIGLVLLAGHVLVHLNLRVRLRAAGRESEARKACQIRGDAPWPSAPPQRQKSPAESSTRA